MIYGASSCMATNLFFYYLDEELLCIYVDDHEKLITVSISCIHHKFKIYQPMKIHFYQCSKQTDIGIKHLVLL